MPRMVLKLRREGGEVWVEESIEIGIASEFWGFHSGIWNYWILGLVLQRLNEDHPHLLYMEPNETCETCRTICS
jgi:hypothetical protein